MHAVRVSNGELVIDHAWPRPQRNVNEVLIQVSLVGICSTDLEIVAGYMDFNGVLGHEFVGRVVSAKDSQWVGRRVVSSINFADSTTDDFQVYGLEHHPGRRVLGILGHDGAMADFVVVPAQNLYSVPDQVVDSAAVFTEPLAAALRITQQIEIQSGTRACVIGPGRLGMLISRVLQLSDAQVVVVGRSNESLQLPRAWGLETVLDRDIRGQTDALFDVVVEATGNAAGLRLAIDLTRPLGTLVLKSTYCGEASVDLAKIVINELNVIGSRCGPFDAALKLLAADQLDFKSLIDAEYPLDQADQAFTRAARPGVRKVLLRPDSGC